MWDDIVISKKDSDLNKLNSALLRIDTKEFSISDNSSSFWISGNFLGIGLTIYKDTKEGIKLESLIKEKSIVLIDEMLYKIIFKKANTITLLSSIKSMKNYAFEEGRREKSKEIRTALGIY